MCRMRDWRIGHLDDAGANEHPQARTAFQGWKLREGAVFLRRGHLTVEQRHPLKRGGGRNTAATQIKQHHMLKTWTWIWTCNLRFFSQGVIFSFSSVLEQLWTSYSWHFTHFYPKWVKKKKKKCAPVRTRSLVWHFQKGSNKITWNSFKICYENIARQITAFYK